MKLLVVCAVAAMPFVTSSVSATLFLLGYMTPIYSLAAGPPHHGEQPVVEGNQSLFIRLLAHGEAPPRVLIRSSELLFSHDTVRELHEFYSSNGIRVEDVSAFPPRVHQEINLLILGNPDWSWETQEITAIRELLAGGGNVLLVVDPQPCGSECRDSVAGLLKALESSLRIADRRPCCAGSQWAELADHPFINAIGPVMYGSTFTVEGGTPLMYQKEGLSMLSADEAIR
jgi:hypothetical protein